MKLDSEQLLNDVLSLHFHCKGAVDGNPLHAEPIIRTINTNSTLANRLPLSDEQRRCIGAYTEKTDQFATAVGAYSQNIKPLPVSIRQAFENTMRKQAPVAPPTSSLISARADLPEDILTANRQARTTALAVAPAILGAIEGLVIDCAKELKATGRASDMFTFYYISGAFRTDRALRTAFIKYGEPDVDLSFSGGLSTRQWAQVRKDDDVLAIPMSAEAQWQAEFAAGRERAARAADRRARYGF